MMIRARAHFVILVSLAVLLAGSAPAAASDLTWGDAPAVAFDVLLLRPLSAIATLAGTPLFLASLPFVAPTGKIMTSLDVFVLTPGDYTLTRPLGDF
jgi:hypothetical protein